MAGAMAAALAVAPPAFADGTETLGDPSIPIADGSDAIVAGVGMQTAVDAPRSFDVTVPAGATVEQVLAYWQGQITSGFGPDRPDDAVSVNGNAVTGSAVGFPTNPYLGELFYTYRADITALDLVDAGTNTLTVSDMNYVSQLYPESSGNKGFGVLVVYDDGSSSTLAGVKDGQDYAYAGFGPPHDTTVPQTINFAATTSDRAATLGLLVGDTLDHNEVPPVGSVIAGRFNTGQTFSIVNQLQSRQGAEFDAENLPVTVPAGATSLTVQILSEGGDRPASLVWIAASLSVDTATPPEEPEPCKPHWGSKYKLLIWIKWWKKWLSHEYGDKHAAKYASYFGGENDDRCKPDEDNCKNRKGGFFFGKHWGHCKPDYDWCKSKYAKYFHFKNCKPPSHDDDCKDKGGKYSSKYSWYGGGGGRDDDCDDDRNHGKDKDKDKYGNILDWLKKLF
jgi:hypothetical protein